MTDAQFSDSRSWSRYWEVARGSASSCLPGAPAAVVRELENTWRAFFDGQPPQARVLDLGTGGGAVLCQALRAQQGLELVGVDYAEILPPAPSGVNLMAGVALEALPFDDAAFDVVTSQFALEYADRAKAVAEAMRVLKPGGALKIVAHHADGAVCLNNEKRRAALADLLMEGGLLAQSLQAAKVGSARDPSAMAALDRLLWPLQDKHGKDGVIMEVLSLMAPMLVAPDGARSMELLIQDVEMEEARLSALSAAALGESDARALSAALSAFAETTLTTITVEGLQQPIAWCIEGVRS